ncbi:serine-enriched protein [Gigaspora margarita]|uniref:Serine-enriched protein n=1 Tax=Gigaspora margarita TaxID=4874 RepID=A0A8H3XMN3_GIGMA|nr:serine-enriched protein [Gigaspora margarita]
MSAEFLNSLSNDFAKLLFNVEDYNVIIKVGRSPNILNFKAHSCVLRTRSTYFHSALSNDWVKTDGNFIAFEKSNISPEVFQMILKYLYSGTICLENQNPTRVIDLIAAADELILTELVNFLKEYLLTHYDEWIRQHALQILYHTAFHSCKELQDICLEMICENPSSVFGTTAFSAIDESVLITILKRDDLQMDEIDLWDYLIQWAIARTPKLKFDVSKWSDGDFQVLQSTLKNCVESENLKNSKLSRIKKNHSRMAVFSADVRGPCFGNRDLWMSNYNNLSKGCSSRNSYYEKNLIDSQEFDLEDYEVFQIFHQQSVNEKTI